MPPPISRNAAAQAPAQVVRGVAEQARQQCGESPVALPALSVLACYAFAKRHAPPASAGRSMAQHEIAGQQRNGYQRHG